MNNIIIIILLFTINTLPGCVALEKIENKSDSIAIRILRILIQCNARFKVGFTVSGLTSHQPTCHTNIENQKK